MANQITQQHENVFKTLLQTVDNAGARAVLSHVWDVLKETIGVAAPVVEAALPEVAPVVAVAETTIEDLDKQIEALLAQKAAKMQAASPAQEPA